VVVVCDGCDHCNQQHCHHRHHHHHHIIIIIIIIIIVTTTTTTTTIIIIITTTTTTTTTILLADELHQHTQRRRRRRKPVGLDALEHLRNIRGLGFCFAGLEGYLLHSGPSDDGARDDLGETLGVWGSLIECVRGRLPRAIAAVTCG